MSTHREQNLIHSKAGPESFYSLEDLNAGRLTEDETQSYVVSYSLNHGVPGPLMEICMECENAAMRVLLLRRSGERASSSDPISNLHWGSDASIWRPGQERFALPQMTNIPLGVDLMVVKTPGCQVADDSEFSFHDIALCSNHCD